MSDSPAVCCLDDLGMLSFRGPDTRKFLQGQLSNDTGRLRPGTLLRAGLHTPQGRTLAVLALVTGPIDAAAPGSGTPAAPGATAPTAAVDDEVLAVLPRELIAATAATLKRYVLRAKVAISDQSASHHIYGVVAAAAPGDPPAAGSYPYDPYDGRRTLVIRRTETPAPAGAPLARTSWRALDSAAGLPQLYLPTSGQFVAQMLNLDCVDAISFDKGCYTGQEVIARAHYRGRVKRRMQRFVSVQPLQLQPGDARQLADGRGVRVVEAVRHEDGRTEFLAVAPLPGAAPEVEAAPGAPDPLRIEATALPLPYALPA